MEHSEVPGERVVRIARCDLSAVEQPWPFAIERASAIDTHWQRRTASNSAFFNGRILMLAAHQWTPDGFIGQCFETGFKDFLYWRETGEPDAGVMDVFGSALIWSSDGGVMLGRQRTGHINAGLAYLPGGFIDPRDVGAGGRIDIAASTAREAEEETGLSAEALAQVPGFILTCRPKQISIGVAYRSPMTAKALREQVMAHLAADPASELAEIIMVRRKSDLDGLAMVPFARLLLTTLLP